MIKAASADTIKKLKKTSAPPLPHELLHGLIADRLKRLDTKYPYEMLGIGEIKAELNCGRDAAYNLLRSGKIKTVSIGNKLAVSKLALAAYLVNIST